MLTSESETDGQFPEAEQNDLYSKKYKLLAERCIDIQKRNQKLAFRIQEVNKITKKRHQQVQFIKERLFTEHGEDWAVIPKYYDLNLATDDDEEEVKNHKPIGGHSRVVHKNREEKREEHEKPKIVKKAPKRKTTKAEKDPNAPKRPSNPFFQFCQEQRQLLMEQIISELKPGESEPTKQELTRQLAIKWKSLNANDKQVYVDMYERSKEKYAAEMTEYNMKK
ncbi:FACT complex subunit SSRP1-like [Onthophagus taurus]|uniref:FACT complex subunit SSRP1-like n=1 Tax=Onthophagus taurus TaxID=166361 RepID=UPI000C20ACF2|nr:HMG1/2-like protein [Onthophagus taurus]